MKDRSVGYPGIKPRWERCQGLGLRGRLELGQDGLVMGSDLSKVTRGVVSGAETRTEGLSPWRAHFTSFPGLRAESSAFSLRIARGICQFL